MLPNQRTLSIPGSSSWVAWERLGIPKEELKNVAWEREVWNNLDKWKKMDGWMDGNHKYIFYISGCTLKKNVNALISL